VQDYAQPVSWAAQTALRDIIGRTTLADLMRDVVIPGALQDAMSREAQASREKQARIILGQAEMEIAHSFEEAARSYQRNPTALHLRAMNMLYEGLKEKGALMLIPSSAVESIGMGGLMGAAALRQSNLSGGGDATGEDRKQAG
jgi:regulator of protease activity HflC (stomatin/prohibitin superfamily)